MLCCDKKGRKNAKSKSVQNTPHPFASLLITYKTFAIEGRLLHKKKKEREQIMTFYRSYISFVQSSLMGDIKIPLYGFCEEAGYWYQMIQTFKRLCSQFPYNFISFIEIIYACFQNLLFHYFF
jgi:hypothetical protein